MVVGLLLVALPLVLVRCGIGDLVNPGEGGRLAVSNGSLAQTAAVGSRALRSVTVDVTSASGRSVGWSAVRAQSEPWLSLTPTAGTVPSTVTITFDPAGLAVGEFRDTILLRADGSDAEPLRVPVTFTIEDCALSPVTPGGGGDAGTLSAADCGAPNRADHFARVYAFDAAAGDSITVVLSSAAFDPYLVIATPDEAAAVAAAIGEGRLENGDWRGTDDAFSNPQSPISNLQSAVPLIESADCPFSPDDACLVNVLLPEDGTYLIEVTTEQPGETGDFMLSVAPPRDPGAPGISGLGVGQFQLGGIVQIPQGEGLAGTEGVFKGRMNDPDGFDSLRLEVEVEPVGTAFDDTPTATGAMVAAGDTAEVVIAGLADAASYHWQARGVDNTGRAGPWRSFGTNGDPDGEDFFTVVSLLPDLPSGLAQARTDGEELDPGDTTPERQVRISAAVSDPDGDDVGIEVEVKPVDVPFNETDLSRSSDVASGGTASVVVGNLTDGVSYHWRARTVDAVSLRSDWVSFGGNPDGEADFMVDVGASGVDPDASTVAADPTTISADGGVATITVTVVNVLGEPVVGAPVTLSATGGGNTITQPGDTDANGQTTGTLSSTAAGDKVVTAVADGVTINTTATIAVTPGAANAGQTTADVPNGTAGSATTITVTVRDASGNQLAAGGETVVVSVTGANTATPGVMDNGDGTYTASYTPVAVGADAVAITLNGAAISGSPYTSTVSSGVADPGQTTADVPDGTAGSATVISVTTRDANGNDLTTGGQTVVVDVTGANTATPTVTDHNDGTYSANYTPTTAGDDFVEITLNGTEISGSPYTSVVSPATGNKLSITTQPPASAQSGVAFNPQPVIQLLDEFDNPVMQSGVEVTALIFSGGGTLGGDNAVETDVNGVATFVDLSITGIVDPRVLTFVASGFTSVNSDAIDITAGAVDAGESLVSASPGTITTDDESTITVTALDGAGNPVSGASVTFSSTGTENTFNPTNPMTDASGVATTQFSSTMPEGKTITAVAGGVTITQTAAVTVTVGGVDAGQSTAVANPTTITTDDESTITVTALDVGGSPVAGAAVTFASDGTENTFNPTNPTTDVNGVATTQFSSTMPEGKTITAVAGGVPITQTVTITVEAGAVSASQSTVTANPTTIMAGLETSTITVTALDANDNPIEGATVVLSATGTATTIEDTTAVTDVNGQTTHQVSSLAVLGEDIVVSAEIDGVPIDQMATVTVTIAAATLSAAREADTPSDSDAP